VLIQEPLLRGCCLTWKRLTDMRNDIAHMRLVFKSVPLHGTDDEWINTASHVEVRNKRGDRLGIVQHDLKWVRSAKRSAHTVGQSLQILMKKVATELGLIAPNPNRGSLS